MPLTRRRPDPATVAAARARLAVLAGGALPIGGWVPAESLDDAGTSAGSEARPEPAVSADAEAAPPDVAVPVPGSRAHHAQASSPSLVPHAGWRRRMLGRLLPVRLLGARLDPTRRGVLAVATVAALAAGAAAVGAWHARPQPVAATPAAQPASVVRPAVTMTPTPGTSVVVSVAGKVRAPGLVTLPSGSRVADALRAAGGLQPGVDPGLLNLARRLVDGEQILVGVPGATGPAGPAAGATGGGLVSLSAATVEQLEALPGVGPVLAQRIVDYRTQHGAFRSVDQLREVSGIGPAKFADLKSLVSP